MAKASFIKKLGRKCRSLFEKHKKTCVNILYYFYCTYCKTLRFTQNRERVAFMDTIADAIKSGEITDLENLQAEPAVVCIWHDELFPLASQRQNLQFIAVVSASKDGSVLSEFLERCGLLTANGSSHKGGLKALLKASRIMKKNGTVHAIITIDGPKGPRHKAKDGAFFLAHHSKAKIVPARLFMHNSIKFNTWDKMQLPLPFSKVDLCFGEGFYVTEELTEEYLTHYRARLESELAELAPY